MSCKEKAVNFTEKGVNLSSLFFCCRGSLFPQAPQQPHAQAWTSHPSVADIHSSGLTQFLFISTGVRKRLGSKRFDYSAAKLLGVWPSHEASSSQAPPRTRGKRHCSGVVSYVLALQVKMTWIPFQSNMLWRQVYHWDCVLRRLDNKEFIGMNTCKWRTNLHL